MAKIGLIIPTYNNSDTVAETLNSVQLQGQIINKLYTLYIADDGSNDNTISLIEANWKNKIPLHINKGLQNVGQWNNVNRAISSLKGKENLDWVLILHSDDLAKPRWLEMMVTRIENCSENIGSICSSWDDLMSDGSIKAGEDCPSRQIEVIEGNHEAVRRTLRIGCWWHISGCAIRVQAFEDFGGFNQKFSYQADWEWLLRCLMKGWSIEYIPRTLILYRQHVSSVAHKAFQIHQDLREFMEIIPNYIHFLESNDIAYLHLQKIKFIVKRMIKSLITLNIQRFLKSFQVLFMLLNSFRKCQKQLKASQQRSLLLQ